MKFSVQGEVDGDGNYFNVWYEYEYDANGNIICKQVYYGNGGLVSRHECEYDTNGNKICERRYDSNGNLDWWSEYDAMGNVTILYII